MTFKFIHLLQVFSNGIFSYSSTAVDKISTDSTSLPFSLCQPHSGTSSSIFYLPIPSPITSTFSDSPLCTFITPSLTRWLKTYLFHKSYPRSFISSSQTASTDLCLDRFFLATRFLILFFLIFSFLSLALD